jgi:hypothetical protein
MGVELRKESERSFRFGNRDLMVLRSVAESCVDWKPC